MWILLLALLLPPLSVALIGSQFIEIPDRTIWVVFLSLPIPIILLSFPKSYMVDERELLIQGWYYRLRIDRETIISCKPVSSLRAMLHPGSLFCSDPHKALKIDRTKGCSLIISPSQPSVFLEFISKTPADEKR